MDEETPGDRIRRIRKTRGMTQAQLADGARMARTDIVKVEANGLRLGPARLGRVADALEVSVLELQPEAEADAPGMTLLSRLEAAEAALNALGPELDRLGRRVAALERQARTRTKPAGERAAR